MKGADIDVEISAAAITRERLEAVRAEIADISNQEQALRDRKAHLRAERDALARYEYEPLNGKVGGSERLVVPASSLVSVLEEYRLNGKTKDLAERSTVTAKTIREIVYGRRKWVALSTADHLLVALGKQSLLTGEVPVVPNPYHKQPRRCDD